MTSPPPVSVLAQPNYTPPRRQVGALVDLYLASADAPVQTESGRAALLCLLRAPDEALAQGLRKLEATHGPLRAHLVVLLGRMAVRLAESADGRQAEAAARAILALVGDADPRAARRAAVAVGKLPQRFASLVEPVLLERFLAVSDPADLRALGEALGKLGGAAARQAIEARILRAAHEHGENAVLADALKKALLRVERNLGRASAPVTPTEKAAAPAIAVERPLPGSYTVVLRCRAGLTSIVADELAARGLLQNGDRLLRTIEPTSLGRPETSGQPGRVLLRYSGSLSRLFSVRTFASLAFALPCPAGTPPDLDACVAAALSAQPTRALFSALSPPGERPRYRLHFPSGHRRAEVYRIADAVRRAAPELLNDPRNSPFQVEISEPAQASGAIEIELVPKLLDDPRFAYRRKDVPAASHPPLAAALCRLGEIGPGDVVWDPFVGSGTELIEVALATRCRSLFGTDLDENALKSAAENAAAAGVTGLTLHKADALAYRPPAPARLTRIVTNPPMGRRTRTGRLSEFLGAFIVHAADCLVKGGRLVWVSPQPRLTRDLGARAGLRLVFARPVDMGGFFCTIEVWEKP